MNTIIYGLLVVASAMLLALSASAYHTVHRNYLLDRGKWTCVATFKDTGECAAYASKRLVELAKANRGPST